MNSRILLGEITSNPNRRLSLLSRISVTLKLREKIILVILPNVIFLSTVFGRNSQRKVKTFRDSDILLFQLQLGVVRLSILHSILLIRLSRTTDSNSTPEITEI